MTASKRQTHVRCAFQMLVLLVALVGCREPSEPVEPEKVADERSPEEILADRLKSDPDAIFHQTPEACFREFQSARDFDDVDTWLRCLAVSDRNQRVGWLAFQVDREAFFQRRNATLAAALLKAYGFEPDTITNWIRRFNSSRARSLAAAFAGIGKFVDPQVDFVSRAERLVSDSTNAVAPHQGLFDLPPNAHLSEVDIRGDLASAVATVPDSEESLTVFFVRENDSWRITNGLRLPEVPTLTVR